MALITAAQFREHTPQLTGTAEDTLLDTLIARADALMAAYCRWPRTTQAAYTLQSATYTMYPRPLQGEPRALNLDFRWVSPSPAPTAYIDPLWAYGASTEVDEADLLIDDENGLLWLLPTAGSFVVWSTGLRDNKVSFVGGFATTPPELVAIAAYAVRHLLGRNRTGGNVATRAGETFTPADADALLPKAVKEALGPYLRSSALVA